jgi:hypothetical protein
MPLTVIQLRKALDALDESELRELIHDLYKSSIDNKRFLTSKLENDNRELLAIYVKELEKCFDPKKGELRVASAKKAMQNYLRVASPIEMLQAKIRYIDTALEYWQKLPYWSENHDTTLGNMFDEVANYALDYSENQEILDGIHRIGHNFIAQEKKFGYFDWHVQIYRDFAKALEQ